MWYKKNKEDWSVGNRIEFPNGDVLKDNHEDSIDGWFWSDDEPKDYLEWQEQQRIEAIKQQLEID